MTRDTREDKIKNKYIRGSIRVALIVLTRWEKIDWESWACTK